METKRLFKETRRNLKMNQTEFAKLLGITRSYLSCVESGLKSPSQLLIRRLNGLISEAKLDFPINEFDYSKPTIELKDIIFSDLTMNDNPLVISKLKEIIDILNEGMNSNKTSKEIKSSVMQFIYYSIISSVKVFSTVVENALKTPDMFKDKKLSSTLKDLVDAEKGVIVSLSFILAETAKQTPLFSFSEILKSASVLEKVKEFKGEISEKS